MKHTEYIIPIGEDAQDYDEMFIGVIRRQPELVRCQDCRYSIERKHNSNKKHCTWWYRSVYDEDYCSRAERKEE